MMKKRFALVLACILVLTMGACKKKKPAPTEPPMTVPVTTEATEPETTVPETTVPETTEAPTEPPTEPPTEATEPPTEPETEPPTEPRPENSFELPEGFERTDEIVYAVRNVNIRADASATAEHVGNLSRGETVQRIGKGDNWSAVVFKNELRYIASEYLTTNGDAHTGNYTAVPSESVAGGTMTTARLVNFRKGPASYTTMLGQIPGNVQLKRLAITTNGWVKVEYKDMEGYVAAGYLTTDSQ